MKLYSRYKTVFNTVLNEPNRDRLPITIFCKSLYTFLFVKIIFLWPVLSDSDRYFPFEFQSLIHQIVYAPVNLAHYNLAAFLISILILLVIAWIVKVNYVTSALIFWFSFSLSRLAFPLVNGADNVLNLFLFLSIFLSTAPAFKTQTLREKQLIISNFTFLFCKIQLMLIYVLSGLDKLTSPAWRSGDAIYSIINLELFMNPGITIPASKTLYVIIAWTIILFELAFPMMIWFKRLRMYALAAGIIFHVVIIFVLSLPDFGLIMLLLYTLFIPSRDRKTAYASNLR